MEIMEKVIVSLVLSGHPLYNSVTGEKSISAVVSLCNQSIEYLFSEDNQVETATFDVELESGRNTITVAVSSPWVKFANLRIQELRIHGFPIGNKIFDCRYTYEDGTVNTSRTYLDGPGVWESYIQSPVCDYYEGVGID